MAAKKKKLTKKQLRRRKVRIFVIEMIILVFVLLALFFVVKLNKINRVELKDVEVNELDESTLDTLSGYTDIAIFGVDNRSNGDTDSGRTDVIMVASVNNDTDEIKLVSVYRDTFLNQSGAYADTYNKANAAYSTGGASQAVNMLNYNLDMDIENYVTVDFNAVADVVDAVGGITIEVTQEEAEQINKYGKEVADVVGQQMEYLDGAGTYKLNGVQAVGYCRIRHTAGDDFKRTERQRTVITKVIKKAKKEGLSTLLKIADTVFPEISTSLSYTEMLTLVTAVFDYDMGETGGFPFEKTTSVVSGKGDCVIPCDLVTNVKELHEFFYGVEDYTPSETVQNISAAIVSITGLGVEAASL